MIWSNSSGTLRVEASARHLAQHPAEIGEGQRRASRELTPVNGGVALRQVEQHLAGGDSCLAGDRVQGEDGLVADAARRDVDHPVERDLIRRVVDQAQEGDHILDFAPAVEPLRAHQPVGQPRLQEGFFNDAGLRVGAVHHGAVAGLELLAGDELGDGVHDKGCLAVIIERFIVDDLVARAAVREEFFLPAVVRLVDDSHGRVEDGLLRAVVLLEQDDLRAGEVLLEALHVAVVRAAPAVHGVMHDDATCQIIVEVIHFEIIHLTVIRYAANLDNFIFDNLSVFFNS